MRGRVPEQIALAPFALPDMSFELKSEKAHRVRLYFYLIEVRRTLQLDKKNLEIM